MIPIGKVGYIQQGEYPGWYVFVEQGEPHTSGYYIYVSESSNFKNPPFEGEGYDYWLEKKEDIEPFFSGWIVEWEA